jgi:hypothetical protein
MIIFSPKWIREYPVYGLNFFLEILRLQIRHISYYLKIIIKYYFILKKIKNNKNNKGVVGHPILRVTGPPQFGGGVVEATSWPLGVARRATPNGQILKKKKKSFGLDHPQGPNEFLFLFFRFGHWGWLQPPHPKTKVVRPPLYLFF